MKGKTCVPRVLWFWLWGALVMTTAMADEPPQVGADPGSSTVCLTIDYGDGAQKRYPEVPHEARMTVATALRYAKAHPRGIDYQLQGQGATSLLKQIDDVKNQGGSGRNWIYRINGKLGKTSFALAPLQPGDVVLWKFDEYQ